jgi:hypothetical protein
MPNGSFSSMASTTLASVDDQMLPYIEHLVSPTTVQLCSLIAPLRKGFAFFYANHHILLRLRPQDVIERNSCGDFTRIDENFDGDGSW